MESCAVLSFHLIINKNLHWDWELRRQKRGILLQKAKKIHNNKIVFVKLILLRNDSKTKLKAGCSQFILMFYNAKKTKYLKLNFLSKDHKLF